LSSTVEAAALGARVNPRLAYPFRLDKTDLVIAHANAIVE
jgi:hypothetical protein